MLKSLYKWSYNKLRKIFKTKSYVALKNPNLRIHKRAREKLQISLCECNKCQGKPKPLCALVLQRHSGHIHTQNLRNKYPTALKIDLKTGLHRGHRCPTRLVNTGQGPVTGDLRGDERVKTNRYLQHREYIKGKKYLCYPMIKI